MWSHNYYRYLEKNDERIYATELKKLAPDVDAAEYMSIDSVNRLRTVKYRDKYMFYLNDELLFSVKIEEISKNYGPIGLIAEYGVHVTFDNFEVYSVQEQP